MGEASPPSLSAAQVARLESFLRAGYQFLTFEQFARFPVAEKGGFVALLDVSGEEVRQFGSVGYRVGSGIGVLVERVGGKAFVWKDQSVPATPELLTAYEKVKNELAALLPGRDTP